MRTFDKRNCNCNLHTLRGIAGTGLPVSVSLLPPLTRCGWNRAALDGGVQTNFHKTNFSEQKPNFTQQLASNFLFRITAPIPDRRQGSSNMCCEVFRNLKIARLQAPLLPSALQQTKSEYFVRLNFSNFVVVVVVFVVITICRPYIKMLTFATCPRPEFPSFTNRSTRWQL
jgi:hypothetical protein